MDAAGTPTALLSFPAARLWALAATVVLASVTGGFLSPLWQRVRAAAANRRGRVRGEKTPPGADPVPLSGTGRVPATAPPADDSTTSPTENIAGGRDRTYPAYTGALRLLVGKDGRVSTSKTITWLWTLVIAWLLLSLVIAGPTDWGKALSNFGETYLALLGGPFAALVLARVAVGARVANGTLQKTRSNGDPSLSDLIAGDDGNPDIFDVQYVMFNVVAVLYVVVNFLRFPATGVPAIPTALVLLTGGPAGVYTANKALVTNPPQITSVSPAVVTTQQPTFTVYGQNFLGGGALDDPKNKLRVQVSGREAQVDTSTATDDQLQATIDMSADDDYSATAVTVTVTTPVGVQAWLASALTIRKPPTLLGVDHTTARPGDVVALAGHWYDPQIAPLTVLLNNGQIAVAPILGAQLTTHSATFTVPHLGAQPPNCVDIKVSQYGLCSQATNLGIKS